MWIVAGAGLVGSLIAFVLSFVRVADFVGSPTTYVAILIAGNVLFVAIPLLIYAARKPHWKTTKAQPISSRSDGKSRPTSGEAQKQRFRAGKP